MDVTLDAAYGEACRALGESIITQRLMAAELTRLATELEASKAAQVTPTTSD